MNLSKGRQLGHCVYGRWTRETQICQLEIEISDAALLGQRGEFRHPQARNENHYLFLNK
jgi:hypothetical protein